MDEKENIYSLLGNCLAFILSIGNIFLSPLIAVVIWNRIVPELFSLPFLTYWQMFGLIIMVQLICGRPIIEIQS